MIAARSIALVALGALTLFPAAGRAESLDQAYQREISFLTTELRALERQKADLEEEYRTKVSTGRDELEALQARLEYLENQAEDLDRQLLDLEIAEEQAVERQDLLESTLEQARISLRDQGIETGSEEVSAATLGEVFEQAGALLAERGRVQRGEGEFFLADGTVTRGQVLTIGGVAAFGVSDQGAGALVPAGGGKFKISSFGLEDTARAVVGGGADGRVAMVLYDSKGANAEESEGKSLKEFISAGGPIGWIIVFLGIGGILMGIARGVLLLRARTDTDKLLRELEPLVEEHRLDAAVEQAKQSSGAAARVVEATIPVLGEDTERIESVANEAILRHLPVLERFGAALTVIAAVAPLLGLLGTVTGMISTFEVITEFGTGDPKMLSGGISEALVTTELGLMVAIPVLMFATLLGAQSQKMISAIEKSVLRLSNVYAGNEPAPKPDPKPARPTKGVSPGQPAPAAAKAQKA